MLPEVPPSIQNLPPVPTASVPPVSVKQDSLVKSKTIRALSMLFNLHSLFYLFTTCLSFGILIIADNGFSKATGLRFQIIKNIPGLNFIPILPAIASVVFMITAKKLSNGSKSSYWLGLIVYIIIPTLLVVVGIFMGQTLFNLTKTIDPTIAQSPLYNTPDIQKLLLGILLNPSSIIFIIFLIFMLSARKKFIYQNTPFSQKAKIVCATYIIFLILPILGFNLYGYYQITNSDYGYKNAQKSVSYKIYKPNNIPGGREHATIYFTNKEIAGKPNGVRVAFDLPLSQTIRENKSSVIILNEVGVESDFNIDTHIEKEFSSIVSKDIISLPTTLTPKAYLIHQALGNTDLVWIVFKTNDNVLITIASQRGKDFELIQLAQSLK